MAKKLWNVLIVSVFILSISALTVHVFPEIKHELGLEEFSSPRSESGEYEKIGEWPLGSVQPFDLKRLGLPTGSVLFSPNGRQWVIGSENGDVIMLDASGKKLWSRRMGVAKISSVGFSHDGERVLIGENSPRGSLLCLNAMSGRELWRVDTEKELGINLSQKIYPAILHITLDDAGNTYAVGMRYEINSLRNREYISRIYKVNPEGKVTWLFPEDHSIDAWIGSLSVTPRGDRIVFGTANYYPRARLNYKDQLYCLDNMAQRVLWSYQLEVIQPFQTATVRNAPAITAEGDLYAIAVGDGRVYAFDPNGKPIWERIISQPWKIAGSYLRVTPIASIMAWDQFVFLTSNTTNMANLFLPTPMAHPNGNSILFFDRLGRMQGKYSANGMIGNIVAGAGQMALSVGVDIRTKDIRGMGVALIPKGGDIPADYIRTEGHCIQVAMSSSGEYIAAIEVPLKLDTGEILGSYRAHLWGRKK